MLASSRAMACADILLEIINQAIPLKNCETSEDRQLLARLALVCRSSHYIAVKALWSSLPSMFPLLRLLSSFVPLFQDELEGTPSHPVKYILSGPVSADEWKRFCHYAAFVSKLGSAPSKNPKELVAPPTWVYLERLSRGQPLLPSLRQLRWLLTSIWSTDLLLLATPALDHLTIDYDRSSLKEVSEWEGAMDALFRHVFTLSTRITHLTLHTRRLEFTRHVPLLSTLVQLRNLKLYQMGDADGLDADQLEVLSLLPELNILRIVVDMYDEPLPVFRGFKRLKKLVVIDTMGSVQKLFATCNPLSLRELDLTHKGYGLFNDWIAASEAIAAHFSRLVKFDWKFCPEDPMELSAAADVLTRTLMPLVSLRLLRHVTVVVEVGRAKGGVSDTLLRTLAEAWPCLQQLTLRWANDLPRNDNLNLLNDCPSTRALEAFATRCPNLERLSLTSFYVPEASLEDVIAYPLSNHPLRVLLVERVRATNPQMAALVLDRLFPRINIEECRRGGGEVGDPGIAEPVNQWAGILGTLEVCRLARITRPGAAGI